MYALKPLGPDLSSEMRAWAEAIRPLWNAADISMRKFAAAANLDPGVVSRYLNGHRVPGNRAFLTTLVKFAEANGHVVSAEELRRLTELQTAATMVATPHEFRVRMANARVDIAMRAQEEAEREALDLAEQLDVSRVQFAAVQAEHTRMAHAWQVERERLSARIVELEGDLAEARARVVVVAEWVTVAREGLEVALAFFGRDTRRLDTLMQPYAHEREVGRLTERFVLGGLIAAEALSMNEQRMPFSQALHSIIALPNVVLVPGIAPGPWPEILALVEAYREGGDAAASRVPLTMDIPGAINASFQFMISALTEFATLPELSFEHPADVARILIEALDRHASPDDRSTSAPENPIP